MRKRIAAIWCGWMLIAAVAAGQDRAAPTPREQPPRELPPLAVPTQAEPPVAAAAVAAEPPLPDTLWFRSDAIFWQMSPTRVRIPIVTTGETTDDCFGGVIGQPSTRVLFGNQDISNAASPGIRFTLGAWLDSAHTAGLETTGFIVFQRDHPFEFGSNGQGSPGIYLSGYNTQLGREDSAIIADAIQQFGGSVRINTGLEIWGGEVNSLFAFRRTERFEWSFIVGGRYFALNETFTLSAVSRDLVLNQQITLDDRFETTNQFVGGQFGSRMKFRAGRFVVDVAGKLALGGNIQTVSIQGQSTSSGPDASNPGSFAGGFYAQPSNMGRTSDVVFAMMPALELKLAYQLTAGIYASVGYDLFYLNQSLRAVDQIDRNLNLSQSAVLAAPAPDAPAAPRTRSESTGFLVQGISMGLEIRY